MTDIFVHIPKTAGSTIRQILERNYDIETQFMFNGCYGEYQDFQYQLDRNKEHLSLLHGHVPFGVHEYIPATKVRYFTFLRDPIARMVSDYVFSFDEHSGYYRKEPVSLDAFIKSSSGFLENPQAHFIAGYHPEIRHDISDEELLEKAKKRLLEDFAAFGIVEMFDESILYMAQRLSWKAPYYFKVNSSSISSDILKMLNEKTIDEMSRKNDVDIALYRFAKDILTERLCGLPGVFWLAMKEFKDLLDTISKEFIEHSESTYQVGQLDSRYMMESLSAPKIEKFFQTTVTRDKIEVENHVCLSLRDTSKDIMDRMKREMEDLYVLAEDRLEEINRLKALLRRP